MAAIVRSGARRLAGSALLQRAPAAGAILQPKPAADGLIQRTQASGPFPARFMSSTKQARRAPPESLYEALDEIQVQKEELYDLIAKSEAVDSQNRQLLKSLSTQIKPRPNDSQWRKMRALELFGEVIKSSIPLSGSLLAVIAVVEMQSIDNAGNKRRQRQADAAAAAEAKEEKLAHA